MSIIVKTRRGKSSYTEYDIENGGQRFKLLQVRIKYIYKEFKDSKDKEIKDYKYACLKLIAITLHQQKQNQPENKFVKEIWSLLERYIDKPSDEELESDPESLFAPCVAKKGGGGKREKTDYKLNKTYGLRTLFGDNNPPTKDQLNDSVLLESTIKGHSSDIKEHACRRVELFFLLCVAFYKTNRKVSLADTDKQHGQAKKGFRYAACHSSLFTRVNDESSQLDSAGGSPSILRGTHLLEVLNSTMELPDSVNKFDSLCEGRNRAGCAIGLRQKLLPVINKVSTGSLSPIEAMPCFFSSMKDFFDNKASENSKKPTKRTSSQVKSHIQNMESEGTFYWVDRNSDKHKPSVGAVSVWMRASYSAAAMILSGRLTDGEKDNCYDRMQREILGGAK
jgi:hypothetical protein